MSVGVIDWRHEGERFEREIYGLVRAMMVKAMRRLDRPYIAFGDMVDDAAIFAWRSWRSLRLRGLEPQEIGIWAIADQCVRMVLGGVQFRPVGRGDRCWADSPYNPRNNCEAHDLAPWHVPASHDEGPDMAGLEDDFTAWLDTLPERDRGIVMAYRDGTSDADVAESIGLPIKTLKGLKKRLAESFKGWLNR
jgi:hypothetical protein